MHKRSSRRGSLRGALVLSALALAGLLSVGASSEAASTLPTLTVAITPTTITVAGAEQSGAVNVVTTATGTKEADTTLILLKPGVTLAEAEALLSSNAASGDPNTVSKIGAVVFDAEAPKGASEAQTSLVAGTYLAINPEGSKSSKWAHSSFTVTASAAPVALPKPAAVVKAIDFNFRGASTLHDGTTVGFENAGYVVHMILGFPVKSKKAAAQVIKGLKAGKEKSLEKLIAGPPVGFAGPLSTGGYQQETITARPGYYVLVCFMDTQDGREHSTLGMEKVIKIAK
jgi:hypothetical protein